MFGICSSLSEVVEKMSEKLGDKSPIKSFDSYTTSHYKLSFLKTITGLYFIFITGVDQYDYRRILSHIYSKIYVKMVCLNPLGKPKELIISPKFKNTISQYLRDVYIQASK